MNAASANSIVGVGLEHICSYWATLAAPESFGPLAGECASISTLPRAKERRRRCESGSGRWEAIGGCCGPMVSAYWTSARLWSWTTARVDLHDLRRCRRLRTGRLQPISKRNSASAPRAAYRATVLHRSCGLLVDERASTRQCIRRRAVASELGRPCHAIGR